MANKRAERRKIRRLQASYSCNGVSCSGITSNFSRSGLFIRTRKPFTPGVSVEISLDLPDGRTICLSGVSVRAKKYRFNCSANGMGVKLVSIPEEYEEFINSLN